MTAPRQLLARSSRLAKAAAADDAMAHAQGPAGAAGRGTACLVA
jgi:hypothetical protein